MTMIPSKIAPRDIATAEPTARSERDFFSCLLKIMLKSHWRQEYREIARYQHLKGRELTDSVALDIERRAPPII